MCVIPWPVSRASEKEDSGSVGVSCEAEGPTAGDKGLTCRDDAHEESQSDMWLCFVFGGMNTEGEIYNDCIVTLVD